MNLKETKTLSNTTALSESDSENPANKTILKLKGVNPEKIERKLNITEDHSK